MLNDHTCSRIWGMVRQPSINGFSFSDARCFHNPVSLTTEKVGKLDIMDIFVDLTSICALAAAEGHRWGWTCQRVCSRRNCTRASCCRWSSLDPLCIHSRKIAPVPHLKFLSNEMALSFTDRKCKREEARCWWWEHKYEDQICSRWSGTANPCTWKDGIGYTWKDGIYRCNQVRGINLCAISSSLWALGISWAELIKKIPCPWLLPEITRKFAKNNWTRVGAGLHHTLEYLHWCFCTEHF